MDAQQLASAAAFAAFALQWARANQKWPEWANVAVIVGVSTLAVVFAGVPFTPLPGFVAQVGKVLAVSGCAAWIASAASHVIPAIGGVKVVPESKFTNNGGSK
jgi:hypothetical protein